MKLVRLSARSEQFTGVVQTPRWVNADRINGIKEIYAGEAGFGNYEPHGRSRVELIDGSEIVTTTLADELAVYINAAAS